MIKLSPIRPGDHVAVGAIEGEVATVQTVTDTRLILRIQKSDGVIERVAVDVGADGLVLAPPTTATEASVLARMVVAGRTPRMPAGRIDMILAAAVLAREGSER